MQLHSHATVLCTGINQLGYGIAYAEQQRLFVPDLLPDEKAEVIISKITKNYIQATINKLLIVSEQRVSPRCPHFNQCGGCDLQQMSYALQLSQKQQQSAQAMRYQAPQLPLDFAPIVASPQPFEYRNKMTFFLKRNEQQAVEACMYQKNSKQLTAIHYCYLHLPLLNQTMQHIVTVMNTLKLPLATDHTAPGVIKHIMLRSNHSQTEMQIVIVVSKSHPSTQLLITELAKLPYVKNSVENIQPQNSALLLGKKTLLRYGKNDINEIFTKTLMITLPPTAFYQVNYLQMQQLYDHVFQLANITANDTVIDYYCGIGTMTLRAAQYSKQVIGVDVAEDAIKTAKHNATINNLQHIHFYAADVEKFMAKMAKQLTQGTIAIIDPPRKGCSPLFLEHLIAIQPKKIVYVSCNPHTLARDMAILVNAGYQAGTIHFFDMFPQTLHVESVVLLTQK